MRVLVTGATGYLGRAVVAALQAAGHDTVAFARHATASGLTGRAYDGDIRDRRALLAAARGCQAICHVAALVSIWHARRSVYDEVNVGGLRNVLETTRVLGIARLVYTSSFLALPPAGSLVPLAANAYQRTKAEAHAVASAAIADGAPLVCLHPGVIYGPGAVTEGNLVGRLVRDHLDRRLPGIVGGDRTWSFAYVGDVARGHVAALERAGTGSHYGLGGENVPQWRLFETVRDQTGCRLPRRLPYGLAGFVGAIEEWRARLTGRLPLVTRGTVEILRHDWPVDSAAAIDDIGYRITPLSEGVRAMLSAWRDASGD